MRKKRARLTVDEVQEIKAATKRGTPPKEIEAKHDITHTTRKRVIKMEGWEVARMARMERAPESGQTARLRKRKRRGALSVVQVGQLGAAQEALANANGNWHARGKGRFLVVGGGEYVECSSIREAAAVAQAVLMRGEGAPKILRVEPIKFGLAIKLERGTR